MIDTGADQSSEKAAKVEVDKNRQTVQLFDKSNALIALIASAPAVFAQGVSSIPINWPT